MKNKNKQQIFNNIIFWLLLFWAVFIFPKNSLAESHLIINEIQITGGSGKTANDFIELYNPTDKDINLKGYRLVKRTKTGTTDTSIKSWTDDAYIYSGDYYLWANSSDGFADNLKADSSTTQTVSDDNGIALRKGSENTGEIIDGVGWGACQNDFVETSAFSQNPGANKSIERKNNIDSDNNSLDFVLLNTPTPKHSQPATPSPAPGNTPKNVKFNEIFPYPSPQDKEFVELINNGKEAVDISDWIIKDASGHKFNIPGSTEIKAGEMLYFQNNFYLNNTGQEIIYLIDNEENQIDTLIYDDAKEDYSYSFNGTAWQWTSLKTPGKANDFDKKTAINLKIKKDDSIYKNIYADFEVNYPDANDSTKYTWNFGDGHKSYLQKTSHKYEEAGIYNTSIKVTDEKISQTLNFMVDVEDYSAPKVRIIRLVPNPKGLDKNEWVEIQNKSKEKINLNGWSIATGWKNLYNHPIKDAFLIKPGKSKKLTKKICAFTLNNTQTKIELRDPSGEVVQKLKYNRKKNRIVEDEIMEKSGKNWTWNKPQNSLEEKQNDTGNANPPLPSGEDGPTNVGPGEGGAMDQKETMPGADIQIDEAELEAGLGKYSENPDFMAKKQNRVQLVGYNTRINTPVILLESTGQVAGAYTERITISEKHWLIRLTDGIWIKINFSLNWVLNRI